MPGHSRSDRPPLQQALGSEAPRDGLPWLGNGAGIFVEGRSFNLVRVWRNQEVGALAPTTASNKKKGLQP